MAESAETGFRMLALNGEIGGVVSTKAAKMEDCDQSRKTHKQATTSIGAQVPANSRLRAVDV